MWQGMGEARVDRQRVVVRDRCRAYDAHLGRDLVVIAPMRIESANDHVDSVPLDKRAIDRRRAVGDDSVDEPTSTDDTSSLVRDAGVVATHANQQDIAQLPTCLQERYVPRMK